MVDDAAGGVGGGISWTAAELEDASVADFDDTISRIPKTVPPTRTTAAPAATANTSGLVFLRCVTDCV